eukprot:CAMPEP_0182914564 /NCGR_PEP_ID=MMETSP0034_2-20130328/38636_1 /TAXON_ID=156128 /ORGANISM="Nephroselmis pyriformis, Strain CCMP717" /LENGTH=56 /DNA_ID=CAMNT_0025051345 /DNA_START=407 /DNA_END=577 /DNA_ORIENTATION=-
MTDKMINLLFAGTDTTAGTLNNIIDVLNKNPEGTTRVRKENEAYDGFAMRGLYPKA